MGWRYNPFTNRLDIVGAGGGGATPPAAPVNSVQFNNAGAFGGSSQFTYLEDGLGNPYLEVNKGGAAVFNLDVASGSYFIGDAQGLANGNSFLVDDASNQFIFQNNFNNGRIDLVATTAGAGPPYFNFLIDATFPSATFTNSAIFFASGDASVVTLQPNLSSTLELYGGNFIFNAGQLATTSITTNGFGDARIALNDSVGSLRVLVDGDGSASFATGAALISNTGDITCTSITSATGSSIFTVDNTSFSIYGVNAGTYAFVYNDNLQQIEISPANDGIKTHVGPPTGGAKLNIYDITYAQLEIGYSGGNNLVVNINATGNATLTLTGTSPIFTFANPVTFSDHITLSTKNIVTDTTTGTKIGTGTTQRLGFFNATPVGRQTDGATLTNNVTSGGTTDTIANYTDLVIYANDAAAIRNDIYQLARKVKILTDALRTLGFTS